MPDMEFQVNQRVVDSIGCAREAILSLRRDGIISRAEQLAERQRFFLSPAADNADWERQPVETLAIPVATGDPSGYP